MAALSQHIDGLRACAAPAERVGAMERALLLLLSRVARTEVAGGYAERGVGIDALVENGAIACSDMRSLPAMVQGIWNNHLRFQDNG